MVSFMIDIRRIGRGQNGFLLEATYQGELIALAVESPQGWNALEMALAAWVSLSVEESTAYARRELGGS